MSSNASLELNGFKYSELFTPEGLNALDHAFQSFLAKEAPELAQRLQHYRHESYGRPEQSAFILELAPKLEYFIGELFNLSLDFEAARAEILAEDPIFSFKKNYVLKFAKHSTAELKTDFAVLDQRLESNLGSYNDRELAIAQYATDLLNNIELHAEAIEELTNWTRAALHTPKGQACVREWPSFKLPKKLDFAQLVDVENTRVNGIECLQAHPAQLRERDGFDLTDKRMNKRQVLNEIHYCVYCHKNQGDFCSSGFPVKRAKPELGFKVNPLDDLLSGCPLDEKISEMHSLKGQGLGVAALATIMLDNPMCPATGHRICNDCMKSCIYQKQEPVNIPQVETGVLVDVLNLPWGVEIYDLLTRWNPLRQQQWIMQPYNGTKVLVMGMGPAGFSLAHHLLMEGCAVVGADGLKVEALPEELINKPIRHYAELEERLSERVMNGFGGVAEYGITVRWDKNFLKLIYLSLLRKKKFQVVGGVRFGGTLTVEDAWRYGFDHLAVAVGAGLARELKIENSLAPGMRQANDFLMALQLTGAAKKTSLAKLQIRLPAVVIGGGLTGIDTATEAQAYYIVQVEKIAFRYAELTKQQSPLAVRSHFNEQSLIILDEFLAHAAAIKAERLRAQTEQREPHFIPLIRQWGGVTVVYRRRMQDSPAYRRNHEEVAKALEEGIYYAEGLEPKSLSLDKFGDCLSLTCQAQVINEEGEWLHTSEYQAVPARSIFVATGAKPNIAYEFEHKGTFEREGYDYKSFREIAGILEEVSNQQMIKSEQVGAFTSYQQYGHRVSYLGDTHPVFHGSVVKAIASAKRLYPQIINSLKEKLHKEVSDSEYQQFRHKIAELFNNYVVSNKRLSANACELIVHAPLAARHFKPGQFYRLQNFERHAATLGVIADQPTSAQMEALALMAAPIANEPTQLSFIILNRGVSSRLAQRFKPNEPVALMGPTGVRTKIDDAEAILVIGGSMATIYLLSMAQAWQKSAARVHYIASFKNEADIFARDRLEAICSQILWLTGNQEISAKLSTAFGQLGDVLATFNGIWIMGSTNLLHAVQHMRHEWPFAASAEFKASVYGPMQCMLKGVCAQCLQWQIDPLTGKRTKAVYACSWHNQPLEIIDISNIDERLKQNAMQETLSELWLDLLETPT